MGVGNINKNNFDLYNKIMQIADTNKKHTLQAKQPHGSVSQKAENTTMEDYAQFSDYGKQRAKEAKNEREEIASRYQKLIEQLESAREQGEAMGESMKVRMKCLLIAMRIMSGDKVPPEDYRYLAKNDLELYAKALMMRTEKEKPQKHKRVSEDEESSEKGGASDSVSAESSQSESGEIQTEANTDSTVS